MPAVNKFFLYLILCYLQNVTTSCSNDGYPYEPYLSSKTPYRIVSNNNFDRINYEGKIYISRDSNFIHSVILGCESKKIWMIIRHGTRNPSDQHINHMKERLPEIKNLILSSRQLPNGRLIKFSFDIIALIRTFRFYMSANYMYCNAQFTNIVDIKINFCCFKLYVNLFSSIIIFNK